MFFCGARGRKRRETDLPQVSFEIAIAQDGRGGTNNSQLVANSTPTPPAPTAPPAPPGLPAPAMENDSVGKALAAQPPFSRRLRRLELKDRQAIASQSL